MNNTRQPRFWRPHAQCAGAKQLFFDSSHGQKHRSWFRYALFLAQTGQGVLPELDKNPLFYNVYSNNEKENKEFASFTRFSSIYLVGG